MEILVFVLIFLAVAAGLVYGYVRKQKRREALAMFALQNRLEYSMADPFGLIDYDFHLFRLGDGRGCENVVWGDWHGMGIKAADYWYYTETSDSHGRKSRTYHRFSVVLTDLQAFLPRVSIEKESLLSQMANALSFRDL